MKHSQLRIFTPEEHGTWRKLFEQQAKKREEQIIDWFSYGLKALDITAERIPKLDEVNSRLNRLTGFCGVVVDGLEDVHQFYPMLARREFPIGNFIRDPIDLSYTPAPDVFHDLYGHLPFFVDPMYADFCQNFGICACKYLDDEVILRQFERLFWFTIEFALIKTSKGNRIFGAGIASSFSECSYALTGAPLGPEVVPFDLNVIRHQKFKVDDLQRRIFILDNEMQLFSCLNEFEAMLRGPKQNEIAG